MSIQPDLVVSITIPAHLVVGVGGEQAAKRIILYHLDRAEKHIMATIRRADNEAFRPINARGPAPIPERRHPGLPEKT